MKLLLIEDNKDIADVVFEYFETDGHQLDYAANGIQGKTLAATGNYDCIILDVMLPRLDGISVCEQLRCNGVDTPIIMLTARDTHDDVIDGFQSGADDYIVKPFELEILEARIHAVIRRTSGIGFKRELIFGPLRIDVKSRQAYRDNLLIKLNPTCFAILRLLTQRAPDPVSRNELERNIWGDDLPDDDVLRKHIYHLRRMVDKPFSQDLITTIPKIGYALVMPK